MSSSSRGLRINLFRIDATLGMLVPVLDTNGNLCIGTVDAGGLSVTFLHVGHLSIYVGLMPSDTTAPVIVPQISGTLGTNGWYRSNVTVSWNVTDPESGIFSKFGCGPVTLTAETAGTTLTCSATNVAGLSNSVSTTIRIDRTAPLITGLPSAGCSIWPPNHKLVQVAVATASDALSGLAPGSFKLTGTSDEPASPGEQDVVIIPTGSFGFIVQLRAERLGSGNGRTYTLLGTATDIAGNTSTATATCLVPHDQRQ